MTAHTPGVAERALILIPRPHFEGCLEYIHKQIAYTFIVQVRTKYKFVWYILIIFLDVAFTFNFCNKPTKFESQESTKIV